MAFRTSEMEKLQELYESRDNNLVFLYGRTGMEQYDLLHQFTESKKVVYYAASECSNEVQREFFAKTIMDICDVSFNQTDYKTMFNRIRSGDASKLVLVVDHVENMLKKDTEFLASILLLKQRRLYPGPVMIIFMTDSLIFAEHELEEDYPNLMKHLDRKMKLSELKFLDVVRRFPTFSVSQSVEVYGVLGGVPAYLNLWNAKRTLKENVCDIILNRKGALYSEAHEYIAKQLREYSVYDTILHTIASGREKLNDMFIYTGYSRPKISVYMKNLMEFEVIEKVSSFETGGWDNAKKGVYRIQNTFLNFWFKFVFPYQSQLEIMGESQFYDKYIGPYLENYLELTFRKVCMEFLELSSAVNQLPIQISKMGTWVGKKGNIDIIAQDKIRNTIVGACSWSEESFSVQMYHDLLDHMKDAKVKAEHCYLFSAKRFDEELIEISKIDPSIVVVDMNEM